MAFRQAGHSFSESAGSAEIDGTTGKLPKFTGAHVIGDSSMSEDSTAITLTKRALFTGTSADAHGTVYVSGQSATQTKQIWIEGSDALHTAFEALNVVLRQTGTFDTTGSAATAGCIDLAVTSTRAAGAPLLTNTAINIACSGGDVNEAIHIVSGDISAASSTSVFGATTATSLSSGGGTFVVASDGTVTLGSKVGSFKVPGGSGANPQIELGTNLNDAFQINTKNTVAANTFAGIQIGGDTTVQSGVRPALLLYRGAGGIGASVEGGIAIAAGSGFPFVGMAANDLGVFHEGGGDLYLGADNSTFVAALKIKSSDNSVRALNGPLGVGGTAGPTWSAGTGTPEGAVTAPVGSLFSRTNGGAGTSFYVKESGSGNTGWVAK